jgi:LysR family transcriptional regulator, benzoate and cis,cis-muconate-responsive activator of ben and cat genes
MELRQLRYFLAVAEELSFSRGAARAGVSQPPLSRQIANLEAELGTRLFDRDKHGVRLTEAGRVFHGEAAKTLAAVDRAVHMTQRAAKGQTGSLALGFGGSAAYTFAPNVLRRFRALYPGVELSLHSTPITAQLERLREGVIDVGFLMLPVHDKTFQTMLLLRDPLVVATPNGHPLTRSKSLALKSIEPFELVIFPRSGGFGFFSHVMAICKRAGFVPAIVQEVAPMESVIGLVAAGVGIAVVPSVARRLRITGVEYRPVRERYAAVEFALAWRRDNTSPVVRAFVDLVAEMKPAGKADDRLPRMR